MEGQDRRHALRARPDVRVRTRIRTAALRWL